MHDSSHTRSSWLRTHQRVCSMLNGVGMMYGLIFVRLVLKNILDFVFLLCTRQSLLFDGSKPYHLLRSSTSVGWAPCDNQV